MNAIKADDTRVIETPSPDIAEITTEVKPAEATAQHTQFAAPPAPTTPARPGETKSPWRKAALFSAIALLAGVGIGFASGIPGKNSLTDQRNTARAEVTKLTTDLKSAKATLTTANTTLAATKTTLAQAQTSLDANEKLLATANADLTTAKVDLVAVTQTRDACALAVTAGSDLVAQWSNILDDFWNWYYTDYGSAAEASMIAHINEQIPKMDAQQVSFDRLATTCQQG